MSRTPGPFVVQFVGGALVLAGVLCVDMPWKRTESKYPFFFGSLGIPPRTIPEVYYRACPPAAHGILAMLLVIVAMGAAGLFNPAMALLNNATPELLGSVTVWFAALGAGVVLLAKPFVVRQVTKKEMDLMPLTVAPPSGHARSHGGCGDALRAVPRAAMARPMDEGEAALRSEHLASGHRSQCRND